MSEKKPLVGIMMGSDNDYDIMVESAKVLKQFDVPFEMIVPVHTGHQREPLNMYAAQKREA